MTQYSLTCINNSNLTGSFAVFQQPPSRVGNVFPLAWFAEPAAPHTQVIFDWTLDHSFLLSDSGVLKPGVVVTPSQVVAAHPESHNGIKLTADAHGKTHFAPPYKHGPTGSFTIEHGPDAKPGQTAVGVGMSGAGTFVVQAVPNSRTVFTPQLDEAFPEVA
jgi:rhizosphere induced protein